ncbi:hypothetical protein KXW36_001744, partial [Aspergillus fumigatus]
MLNGTIVITIASTCHDALAVGINDLLAVFLGKSTALLGRDQIKHFLGRTAQLYAERGYDKRAIDKDRVLHHRVDQLRVSEIGIAEPQFSKRRALFAKQSAGADTGPFDQAFQQRARWG